MEIILSKLIINDHWQLYKLSLISTIWANLFFSGVRPFGVSLLVCGWDKTGPKLYQCDPSGAYFAWKATALGKNYVNSKQFLEKR